VKDVLAEQLLAKVLAWEPNDIARERPILQAMAALKYDEYEQFSPGLRFLESLALWLNQFEPADRQVAYRFVKSSLVFCSAGEMDHLVDTAYQDHIRPILLARSARENNVSVRQVGRIASSAAFRSLQRQTLFLGLSDGARIDTFRRANPDLNHEQIWQTHELSGERVKKLLEKLSKHLSEIAGGTGATAKFSTIVLLDDFSASGTSYYAKSDSGPPGGKIATFLQALADEQGALRQLCSPNGVEIIVLIYMATEHAIQHLRSSLAESITPEVTAVHVDTVQLVPSQVRIVRGATEPEIVGLIEKYYNGAVHDVIFDVHLKKGGTTDGKYGYADCGLPVVLHHNTPNNSLAILWFYERCALRGLFPRVQRHREMT